ncbi:NAD(P)H-quinone oxidoreductase [Flavitalea flava]
MKAIFITEKGGPEVLQLKEVANPVPAEGEVLIKVRAIGLNRSDILSRKSKSYSQGDSPEIPGLEVSGMIESTGPGIMRWKKGDKVCALVNGGGYAEYVAVPAGQCLPVPKGLSLEEAAALPEVFFTIWHNVFQRGRLRKGENFLVHGGTSGIGVSSIQLAIAWGAKVYTTAGTDEKCRFCEGLGAQKAINYKTHDFEYELKGIKIDTILDMTGGENVEKNIRVLNTDGRLVFINGMQGMQATIDIGEIMRKRVIVTGSMLKPRDTAFKTALSHEVEKNIWPLMAEGKIKPIIYKQLPLEQAAEAQRLMETSEHIGKILLIVG